MNSIKVFSRLSLAKKALPLFLIVLLSIAASVPQTRALSAVIIDSTAHGYCAACSTLTISVNVTADANGFLVVFIDAEYQAITSASYAGVPMSLLGGTTVFAYDGGVPSTLVTYVLPNPPIGVNNLVIQGAAQYFLAADAVSLLNIDHTAPVDGAKFFLTDSGTGAGNIVRPFFSITTYANDLILTTFATSNAVCSSVVNSTASVGITNLRCGSDEMMSLDYLNTTFAGNYTGSYTLNSGDGNYGSAIETLAFLPAGEFIPITPVAQGSDFVRGMVIIIIILAPAFALMAVFSKEPNLFVFLIGALIGSAIAYTGGFVNLWLPVLLGVGLIVYGFMGRKSE